MKCFQHKNKINVHSKPRLNSNYNVYCFVVLWFVENKQNWIISEINQCECCKSKITRGGDESQEGEGLNPKRGRVDFDGRDNSAMGRNEWARPVPPWK